jgi:hypothetical protein
MAIEANGQRSRRALLFGAAGGIAAVAAQALGRPLPVAADGETVRVGGVHANAMSPTVIRNRVNSDNVFVAESRGEGTALMGRSARGTGVEARGETGLVAFGGRYGIIVGSEGDGAAGLLSSVSGPSSIAVEAHSQGGLGVVGITSSESSAGVSGQGPSIGVEGFSVDGAAILGDSPFGTALRAVSGEGVGLDVQRGRVTIAQVSGVAVIPGGATSTTVTPGVDVVPGAFVLLTPRRNLGGRDLWYTTNAKADTFTIHISEGRPRPTPVAWLLIG